MKLEEALPNPVLMDLRPDKALLDPKFDGYKLSLDPLPKYTMALPEGVDKVGPADDEYSVQHVKLFALHNFLYADPYLPHVAFIVDKKLRVQRVQFENNEFKELKEVWTIPTISSQTRRYNVSITFPSKDYAVVGDGCSILFLLETGQRDEGQPWKVVYEQKDVQDEMLTALTPFVVFDAKLYEEQQHEYLDVLLLRLQDRNNEQISKFLKDSQDLYVTQRTEHPFVSKLHWVTLKKEEKTGWTHDCTRNLTGLSAIDYATVETKGTGVLAVSENHLAYSFISNEPLRHKSFPNKKQVESDKPDYVWMQGPKDLTILFKIPLGITKENITVNVKPQFISIVCNGNSMLEGELLNTVKADEIIWTINPITITEDETQEDGDLSSTDNGSTKQYQSLEVILEKVMEKTWEGDSVVKGISTGQQIVDPEFLANLQERLNHLCSDKWNDDPLRTKVCDPQQLEECDALPADTSMFLRVDRHVQGLTHVANLGGHQWLFSGKMRGCMTPSICIRHDVDGLVWQPQDFDKPTSKSWKLDHIGTFSAMGYVQASKEQRKFTVSPPDLSYVAICDVKRHVYIYRQPSQLNSDLRNRKTGQKVSHISKQHVVSLEPVEDTLGVVASTDFLFILTSNNLHAIRINNADEEGQ